MEPKETHNTIEELLSAAVDGEVSLEEHAQAEEALSSPEWASHAAFLSILKDSARFEDLIEVPSSLSERIALATHAKPTLWSPITGALRPSPTLYASGGLPAFLFEDENAGMQTKVALGIRAAGGVELEINGHLSVQADAGLEYFFNIDENALVDGKRPERTLFVPTVGVIGRL